MKTRIILCGLFLQSVCFGQDFVDLFNLYCRYSPENESINDADKVDFTSFAVDVKLPVPVGEKTTVIAGAECVRNEITFRQSGQSWLFSSVLLQLGLERKWNDRVKTLALAIPKWASDFSGIRGYGNFQFGGIFLNTIRKNAGFDWRFGAYANGERFGLMIVPLFGFNWKINQKWRLKTLLPVNLELSRTMTSKWIAGFLFVGANASYQLNDALNPGTGIPGPYMDKADNNAWLYSDFYISRNIVIQVRAGYSVLRKYRIYDTGDRLGLKVGPVNIGDNRADAPMLMKDGWSFESRLIFRLPLTN